MPTDPYAVLRALLRAEAARSASKQPQVKEPTPRQTPKGRERG